MFEKAGDLPSGYTQYDWVQADSSTGTPAIDTLYSMNFPYATKQKRYEIEGKFANVEDCPSTWDKYVMFASTMTNYTGGVNIVRQTFRPRDLIFCYNNNPGTGYAGGEIGNINYGEWHNFKLTYKDTDEYGGLAIVDGNTISSTQTGNNATTSNLQILGFGTQNYAYPCRLARLKVYDYGVLACDLVPAKRNSDGVVGLYDVVRDIFCPPSGEGVTLLCGYGFANFNT